MKYFQTIFTVVFPFAVTLFVAYLIGSFINTSFNPIEWTIESRQFMSLTGLIFGFGLFLRLELDGLA